jgi:phosphate transport system substrate-binding protein
MTWRLVVILILLAGAALLPFSCASSDTITIQGAGATFPEPLYKRWFLEYYLAHPDVRVNYTAIGSGAGVSQLEEGLTDFAASDEALTKKRLDEVARTLADRERRPVDLIQVPLTGGAVALCYNLPGDPELQLSRQAYVGMALGAITYWDDEAIQQTNPNVTLPHQPIVFIRRAESSGTTFVFTTHLNAIDERWRKENDGPGASKTPQWKVGIGGKGNGGVAALIDQTPGAFGYIEAGFAELIGLKIAKLQNHAGAFVAPTGANCLTALAEARFNDVFGATIPDPTGQSAYPIVTFTWVIVRKEYADRRLGETLRAVLSYCLEDKAGEGQALCDALGYVELPRATLERARQAVAQINAGAGTESSP